APLRQRSRLRAPSPSTLLKAALVLLALAPFCAHAQQRALPLDALRPGIEFSGADARALQSDDLANPGFLWVDRGEKLWADSAAGQSCASCHGDASKSMRGIAARYPAYDANAGAVVDCTAALIDGLFPGGM